jgi:hypothetical protein
LCDETFLIRFIGARPDITMPKGGVVILDNLAVHKSEKAAQCL